MQIQARHTPVIRSRGVISAYDDAGLTPDRISSQQRTEHIELIIQRYFANQPDKPALVREAVVRSINPCADFAQRLHEAEALAEGDFGPQLRQPSPAVTAAFRDYGQTDLGAVALARLLAWDNRFIEMGWRATNGALTEAGIAAYGTGRWRPFRVASNGYGPDIVTPSGVLVLPDDFFRSRYSTGDIADPLAILHHEIKAHVLPMCEAAGLHRGKQMELICIRLESEMLGELGLPERRLNWGRDDGTLNHTLHESTEQYYHGLVRHEHDGALIEIEPETGRTLGWARVKS